MASKTKSPWYFFVGRENSLKGFGSVGMRSIYVIWIQKFFPYNHLECLMGMFILNSSVVSFQKWVWRFNQNNNIMFLNQKLSSYWPFLYISHKNPRCLIAWVFTAAGSSFIFLVNFKFSCAFQESEWPSLSSLLYFIIMPYCCMTSTCPADEISSEIEAPRSATL